MSASTQTLQQPRRIRTSAILVLAAMLVTILVAVTFASSTSDPSQTIARAPAITVSEGMSPGAGAADRQDGRSSAAAVRPGVFRGGSVKIGSSAGFVPPHGAGDFREGPAKGTYAGTESNEVGGSSEPIDVGGFACHQCR